MRGRIISRRKQEEALMAKTKQFTISIPNQPGALAEIATALVRRK